MYERSKAVFRDRCNESCTVFGSLAGFGNASCAFFSAQTKPRAHDSRSSLAICCTLYIHIDITYYIVYAIQDRVGPSVRQGRASSDISMHKGVG